MGCPITTLASRAQNPPDAAPATAAPAPAPADEPDDSGATLRVIAPPGFEDRRLTILALALAALALGFVLLYRKSQAAPAKGKSGS